MNIRHKKVYYTGKDIIFYETWTLKKTNLIVDYYHNPNGPVYKKYYEDGNISYMDYAINNEFHNMNGPARIWYFENGEIKNKSYYINGKQLKNVESDEELKKYIKLQNIL